MELNVQKAEFIRSAAKREDFPRDTLPQVVFSGRSNVGKSSVINRLLNRKNLARVGSAPGKTTHINYFLIDEKLYLVDLPGYGYAKVSKTERARWGQLIETWFADTSLMTLGVMLVDIRHKPTADDCIMAEWFKASGKPFLIAANKQDKIKKSELIPNTQRIRETLGLPEETLVIPFSAEKGVGREELLEQIITHMA
ncbi:MAG: engB [Firmicutes bacterium]|nr:engB [Bacillota bacterium]